MYQYILLFNYLRHFPFMSSDTPPCYVSRLTKTSQFLQKGLINYGYNSRLPTYLKLVYFLFSFVRLQYWSYTILGLRLFLDLIIFGLFSGYTGLIVLFPCYTIYSDHLCIPVYYVPELSVQFLLSKLFRSTKLDTTTLHLSLFICISFL